MQKTASDSKVRKWDGFKAEKCLSQNKRREEKSRRRIQQHSYPVRHPKVNFSTWSLCLTMYIMVNRKIAIFLIKVQES